MGLFDFVTKGEVAKLADKLRFNKTEKAQTEAAIALGKIGNTQAIEHLVDAMTYKNPT